MHDSCESYRAPAALGFGRGRRYNIYSQQPERHTRSFKGDGVSPLHSWHTVCHSIKGPEKLAKDPSQFESIVILLVS